MQKYEKPEFEYIKFEVEDVIATSTSFREDELPPVEFGLRNSQNNDLMS